MSYKSSSSCFNALNTFKIPLKLPPCSISERITSSHFSLSSLHCKYLFLSTQHGIKIVEIFDCGLATLPIF